MKAIDWYNQNKDRLGDTLDKSELREAAEAGIKKSELKGLDGVTIAATNWFDNKYQEVKNEAKNEAKNRFDRLQNGQFNLQGTLDTINSWANSDDEDQKAAFTAYQMGQATDFRAQQMARSDAQEELANKLTYQEGTLDQEQRQLTYATDEQMRLNEQANKFEEGRRTFMSNENKLTRDHEATMNSANNQTLKDVTDKEVAGRAGVALTETEGLKSVATTQADADRDVATTKASAAENVANTEKESALGVATTQAGAAQEVANTQKDSALGVADRQKDTALGVADRQKESA